MDDNAAVSSLASNSKEPKKYIRTFAGDMEILQKGGTPDLVPLTGTPESAGHSFVAPPLPPVRTQIPIPTPARQLQTSPFSYSVPAPVPMPAASPYEAPFATANTGEPEEYIRTLGGDMEVVKAGGVPDLTPMRQSPRERLIASSPFNPPTPFLAKSPSLPPRAPAPPALATPIETYESDFSQRLRDTRASTATVLAAEQDRADRTPLMAPEVAPKSGIPYIIAGIILVGAGIAGAYVEYVRYVTVSAPLVMVPLASAPIFVDEREEIRGTGQDLLIAIEQSVTRPPATNAVRLLYMASTTTRSVFSSLPLSAPDILLRNVNASGSMAGVVNVGGVSSPFFILSVSSYGDTFSGMLSWEPVMPRALSALFPANVRAPVSTTTALQSKSTTAAAPSTLVFHDEVASNHDVRVYRDPTGRVVFLYGYWNQATLVVAQGTAAFGEILQRLANSRVQ